jgi:hypothetical protein
MTPSIWDNLKVLNLLFGDAGLPLKDFNCPRMIGFEMLDCSLGTEEVTSDLMWACGARVTILGPE